MKVSTEPSKFLSGFAALFCLVTSGSASTVAWVEPSAASDTSASFPSGGTYTSNFGIVFKTGSSGTFSMDWLLLGLFSSGHTATSATLKVELREPTSSVPYQGVASTNVHTTDTVTLTMPGTTNTNFDVNLTAADAPNLMGFTMDPNTAYSLIVYSPSVGFTMRRKTGYSNGTTNDYYTVTDGFQVLDTFRNNTANYNNNPNSFPTLSIAFGGSGAASVPEPAGAGAALLVGSAGMGLVRRRKR